MSSIRPYRMLRSREKRRLSWLMTGSVARAPRKTMRSTVLPSAGGRRAAGGRELPADRRPVTAATNERVVSCCGWVKTSKTSPCSTTRPCSSTATRWQMSLITAISWVISTMVRPSFVVDVGDSSRRICLRRLRVERRGRLVAEQHLGLVGERAGDADALLLPAGELRRIAVLLVGRARPGPAAAARARGCRALAMPGQLQRQRDVVQHGARGQQIEMLEDHADAPALLAQCAGIEAQQLDAVDHDDAARRPLQQVDDAHQRALAGAAAADHPEDLAAATCSVTSSSACTGAAPCVRGSKILVTP